MTKVKLFCGAAALSLAAALAAPTPSLAFGGHAGGHMGGGHMGAMHMGGGGHWRGGGWWPGAVAGAIIGGAVADSYAYYGGPYYYGDDDYYGPDYYEEGPAVAVAPGGNGVAYCEQRYRSYDPASGTYLGYDGMRHPCP